jgi:hypothetical protein
MLAALSSLFVAAAEAANVTKYEGEVYEMHKKKESSGIGFCMFVYLTMVHVVLACLAKKHFDRWMQQQRRREADLSFITTTVDELKVECRKEGLPVTGRKAELLDKLSKKRPDFAKKKDLLELESLMARCRTKGMEVHLKDVMTVGETQTLLEKWRHHVVD